MTFRPDRSNPSVETGDNRIQRETSLALAEQFRSVILSVGYFAVGTIVSKMTVRKTRQTRETACLIRHDAPQIHAGCPSLTNLPIDVRMHGRSERPPVPRLQRIAGAIRLLLRSIPFRNPIPNPQTKRSLVRRCEPEFPQGRCRDKRRLHA
jgi:hypothetical protein